MTQTDETPMTIPLDLRYLTIVQSADAFLYYEMISETSRTVRDFCKRSGAQYEMYLGVKRGFWSWHATYNRLPLMTDLYDRGYRGWVMYLDADSYIVDLDFPMKTYLQQFSKKSAILVPSGVSEDFWNVNDGVMLLNLGHLEGPYILKQWMNGFLSLDDATLKNHPEPFSCSGTQSLLHKLLQQQPNLRNNIHFESRDLLNSTHASFIRQNLRSNNSDLSSRITAIRDAVDEIMSADRVQKKSTNERLISAAYESILGRPADKSGMMTYAQEIEVQGLEQGLKLLLRSLLSSDEYAKKRPDPR